MPADSLRLLVRENDRTVFETTLGGALEIGRQRADETNHALYTLQATDTGPGRLLVAANDEKNIGRQHLLLEPLPSGRVRVSNGSQVALQRSNGEPISPAGSVELAPPFHLHLPGRTLSVLAGNSVDEFGIQGFDAHTLGPSSLSDLSRSFRPVPPPGQLDDVARWLHATMSVLQSAVGASDFLPQAAEALVQIVGLDSGRVLLLEKDNWAIAAQHACPSDLSWQPSRHVLERVRDEKRAFWQRPRQCSPGDSDSLLALDAVVAAPLLDRDNLVIGALYAERCKEAGATSRPCGQLEALLVDLLACGVSTGLARQQQEKAALEARVRFEQFFSSRLADELARNPDMLRGADRKVTLLFCDVRGFSAFSERLGPEKTMEWMGDVMGVLSECVLAEEGVLVDYVGDELFAMWGAPREQVEQAERAVRAGLAMLGCLADLNQRWRPTLGKDMDLGVGVNTGVAQVGNTGSKYKFKYGALGNPVNLASRVQGLTEYLRCRLLVSRATREQLGDAFLARRVVRTHVVNISAPVDLFEIACPSDEHRAFFRDSEEALDVLESAAEKESLDEQLVQFTDAARRSGALLAEHAGDGPVLLTLSRATSALVNRGAGFDPVWEPPGK